jgi:hypothetical protein
MNKTLFLFFVVVTATALSNAQNNPQGANRQGVYYDNFSRSPQQGFAGYLAANAGYSGYNRNSDVEGTLSSLKAIASYVTVSSKAVFDLGYGVQTKMFSQDAAKDSSITTDSIELALRYQYENRWQLGGIFNTFFNKGESYKSNQADANFGGAQLLREFNVGENFLGRVGGRFMTSLNEQSDSTNMVLIDLQLGWGGANKSRSVTAIGE